MQSIFENGHGIGVVRPETFGQDTAQTPGSHRVAAITREHGTPSSMWGGVLTVAAGGQTAIHHHGKQDAVVYVLAGTCLIRWGRHGEFSATARAGDFVHVPARSTRQPIVVNLPDEYWPGGRANGKNYRTARHLEDSSYV